MTKIACIGEAMIELSTTGSDAKIGVAGDTLNTAIYLKRAAPSIDVSYVTCLGDDPFSQRIHDFITAQDIDCNLIGRVPNKSPGLYAITTRDDGERSFTYWRDSAAARDMFSDGDFSALDGFDALYLSGISLAILPPAVRDDLIAYLAQSQAQIIYDSNHRPKLWPTASSAQAVNATMWDLADIALPSIDDEMLIYDETAEEVEKRFAQLPKTGALKRGPGGPMPIGAEISQTYPQAPKVIDTTAAGDSFNGGYIAARLSGSDAAQALMAGHMCAHHVVQHKGAIVPV